MTPTIQLQRMSQVAEALDPEDDWTGTTSAVLRKRKQNRLNVRAYRRRKALEATQTQTPVHQVRTNEPQIPYWDEGRKTILFLPATKASTLTGAITPPLLRKTNTPQLNTIIFPLSSDHLIVLLQYNVIRGLLVNHHLLRLFAGVNSINYECTVAGRHISPDHDAALSHQRLPETLHPTHLQKTVPHDKWIDLIPHPVLRDNMIRAAGTFDDGELCRDTIGGLYEGFADSEIEHRGIVMWSPPWLPSSWEISEGFARKWGWTMKGCQEIVDATNRRRRERGQDPIMVEV